MGSDNLFYKKKIRKEKELARRQAIKAPYETIYIICEDGKSSPYYFKECRKYFKLNTANVIVLPGKGSAPITIIEHAIELAKNTSGIDCIACVFDHDNHESYSRAIKRINNQKPKQHDKSKPQYMTITSTPCFELWLLLHFRYTTKAYNSTGNKSAADNLISDLCEEIPGYYKNKENWFDHLKYKFGTAIKNAKQLEKHNIKTSSTNPATNIHELIEYLMNLKQPSI